jgi:hypothetical protein
VALLDVAHQADVLSAPDRKWRTVFANHARTAADLLVLFLDTDRNLRPRREDPELAASLARLAFVPKILEARSRHRLSRAEFESVLERTASGESLDTLRAELGVPERPRIVATEPVVAWPVAKPASESVPKPQPVVRPTAPTTPVTDVDRARIAKHLTRALYEERLDVGEHAARTVALWSATTTGELAKLVVDLPVPVDEPLRDRKPNPHSDDLITPAHRQAVLDRLNRVMAANMLTLWEYETRLDVALKARTFEELGPATADLPPA